MENVRGHLSLGFAEVLADLTAIGYDAEWRVISAASVGANHRRDRIIIVAYPDGRRLEVSDKREQSGQQVFSGYGAERGIGDVADSDHARERTPECNIDEHESSIGGEWNEFSRTQFGGFGTEMADTSSERLEGRVGQVFEGNRNGFTYEGGEWWQIEPDVGRVADGIPSRVDRLRCLGNAVVPQVAEIVGRLIIDSEND